MNGWIFSIVCVVYSGYCLNRVSRLEVCVVGRNLLYLAFLVHTVSGWFSGSVWILVKFRSIFPCRRICGGGNSVSVSIAAVAVVLKHPMIAFIAYLCTLASLVTGLISICWVG